MSKLKVVCLVAAVALTAGCVKQYSVTMGDQPPAQAHYVVVKVKASGGMRVYDCVSYPNGEDWEPTCVKADMRDDARE